MPRSNDRSTKSGETYLSQAHKMYLASRTFTALQEYLHEELHAAIAEFWTEFYRIKESMNEISNNPHNIPIPRNNRRSSEPPSVTDISQP